MRTLNLPIVFASGSFIDAVGKTIMPGEIIGMLNVHDDLLRVVELLYNYRSQDCPPLVLQDASQTLAVAKGLQEGYFH